MRVLCFRGGVDELSLLVGHDVALFDILFPTFDETQGSEGADLWTLKDEDMLLRNVGSGLSRHAT